MTPNQIYESFIIKTNENAQTDNIAVDKGRFVRIYNESANKFVEWVLEKKNEDDIRYLQPILTTKTETSSTKKEKYQLFKLPKDFFDLGNVSAKASSDCCSKVDIELFEIKTDNENIVMFDELRRPSIEYREAPFYLQENSVKVFKDNFTVDSVEITYYKYPQSIELVDEEDPESDFKNPDTHLEFDNKVIDRIISIAVSDNSLNTSNPRSQADKMRVITKF